jgi:hypothetical protein
MPDVVHLKKIRRKVCHPAKTWRVSRIGWPDFDLALLVFYALAGLVENDSQLHSPFIA